MNRDNVLTIEYVLVSPHFRIFLLTICYILLRLVFRMHADHRAAFRLLLISIVPMSEWPKYRERVNYGKVRDIT